MTHAAFTTVLPLTPLDQMLAFTMPSGTGGQPVNVHASLRTTSAGYFAVMGIRLVEGRTFNDGDVTTSAPVVVVNRTFARSYLTDSAIGRRIPVRLDEARDDWTIVGVVDDVLMRSATEPPQPEIYVCSTQLKSGLTSDPALVIRAGNASRGARRIGPQHHPRTGSRARARFGDDDGGPPAWDVGAAAAYAVVLGGFAFFAMVIAAVGLFGILSYTVAQRSREIGVRTALGATRADIVRLVIGQAAGMTVVGVIAGLAGLRVEQNDGNGALRNRRSRPRELSGDAGVADAGRVGCLLRAGETCRVHRSVAGPSSGVTIEETLTCEQSARLRRAPPRLPQYPCRGIVLPGRRKRHIINTFDG